MRVLILGCGYVGLALGANLVRRGHNVCGLRRSHRCDAEFKAAGIVPLVGDITLAESLVPLDPSYDWVVSCVSASGGAAVEYDRIYLQGSHRVLSWLSAAPPAKFVYTSSTSVYGQNDGSAVDESSPTLPEAETARILVRAEDVIARAASERGFPAVVLRVAGIYGPGRTYWVDQVKSGEARVEGSGDRNLNNIHRDDVVGAILAALASGRPGRVYNVVDDEPVTQLVLLQWLSKRLGRALPLIIPDGGGASKKRGVTNKRVSNARLKAELGYCLKFPTFREGYESVLRGES
jgi:nucleoside-diphosphate-sugar epimerase